MLGWRRVGEEGGGGGGGGGEGGRGRGRGLYVCLRLIENPKGDGDALICVYAI